MLLAVCGMEAATAPSQKLRIAMSGVPCMHVLSVIANGPQPKSSSTMEPLMTSQTISLWQRRPAQAWPQLVSTTDKERVLNYNSRILKKGSILSNAGWQLVYDLSDIARKTRDTESRRRHSEMVKNLKVSELAGEMAGTWLAPVMFLDRIIPGEEGRGPIPSPALGRITLGPYQLTTFQDKEGCIMLNEEFPVVHNAIAGHNRLTKVIDTCRSKFFCLAEARLAALAVADLYAIDPECDMEAKHWLHWYAIIDLGSYTLSSTP